MRLRLAPLGRVSAFSSLGPTRATGRAAQLDGWTVLTPSSDTRKVYVSSSKGDDGYNGLFPEPAGFQSLDGPKATISAGKNVLRDGKPDWLLLRRGDTWTGQSFGAWQLKGRSASERMVIGAYDPIGFRANTVARPRIITPAAEHGLIAFGGGQAGTHNYLAIVDLDMEPASWVEDYNGITWHEGHDLLVEGCRFTKYHSAIGTTDGQNLSFRRNVIYQTARNSFYLGGIDGLLVEDNILYQVTNATYVNNWVLAYVDHTNTGVTVRNNMAVDCSVGILVRCSGTVDGNVVFHCHRGISLGGKDGDNIGVSGGALLSVNRNAVTDTITQASSTPSGFNLENIGSCLLEGNIVANYISGPDPNAFEMMTLDTPLKVMKNVTFRRNVTYGFNRFQVYLINDGTVGAVENIAFENNTFHGTTNDALILVKDSLAMAEITSSGNRFYSPESPAPPSDTWMEFSLGTPKSVAQWKTATGDSTSTAGAITWGPGVPSQAKIAAYAQSIGAGSTLAAFMATAILQRKGNWLLPYTAGAYNAHVRACFDL